MGISGSDKDLFDELLAANEQKPSRERLTLIRIFEACFAFICAAACTLALSPYIVTRYPEASATSSPP